MGEDCDRESAGEIIISYSRGTILYILMSFLCIFVCVFERTLARRGKKDLTYFIVKAKIRWERSGKEETIVDSGTSELRGTVFALEYVLGMYTPSVH